MDEFQKQYHIEGSRFYYDYCDGMAIVIDSATGMYYGMSVLGSAVFNRLVKGEAPGSVLEQLRSLNGCPSEIDQMFAHFFSQVMNFGLLISEEKLGRSALPFEEGAIEGGFSLEVKEFAEVQEILLADPVHDVQSDFGWPVLKEL